MDIITLIITVVGLAIGLYFILPKKGKKTLEGMGKHIELELGAIQKISWNTRLFRFKLPSKNHTLGLPIGQHVALTQLIDGKEVRRSYTPISSDDNLGVVDLLIKVYEKGLMTQYLDNMKVGQKMKFMGPKGKLNYEGDGQFKIQLSRTNTLNEKVKNIGMIAGGTGITPMLQIIRNMHKSNDKTNVSLLFANVTEKDILLRDELEKYDDEMNNLNLHYTVDKSDNDDWKYSTGFVTPDMISKHLPGPQTDCLILLCGPLPMIKFMKLNLENLGYKNEQVFAY